MNPPAFVKTRSESIGPVTATASADSEVLVATKEDGLLLVSQDGMDRLDISDEITDASLGSHIHTIGEGRVRSFDRNGERSWSGDVDGAEGITVLPESELVIVQTDDQFIGFDETTGSVRFELDHPHPDVATSHHITGGPKHALITAWWFLTVIDGDGSLLTDMQVDGAISAVGILEDVAVVLLQDSRLLGIDLTTGEQQWSQTMSVDWVAPNGTQWLFIAAGDELQRLSSDGSIQSVGRFVGGTPCAAATGDPICFHDDQTLSVYRPTDSASLIEATVDVGSTREEAVEIRLRNQTAERVEASIDIDGVGVDVGSESVTCNIDPNETSSLSIPFHVEGSTTATIRGTCTSLLARDRPAGSEPRDILPDGPIQLFFESLSLESGTTESTVSSEQLKVDLEAVSIDNGDLEVEVTLSNRADSPLRGLTIHPSETRIESVPGGSATSRTVSLPLGTESITIRGGSIDASHELPRLSSPPIEVGIERTAEGFVDIRLQNLSHLPYHDELAVSGEALPGTIRRSIEVPPEGDTIVALPLTQTVEAGTIDVTLTPLETTRNLDVDRTMKDSSLSTESFADEGTDADFVTAESTGESTESTEGSKAPTQDSSDSEPASQAGVGNSNGGDQGTSATDPNDATRDVTSPPSPERAEGSKDRTEIGKPIRLSDAESEKRTEDEPPSGTQMKEGQSSLTASRELSAEEVQEGFALEETISLSHRSGSQQDVEIESKGAKMTVTVPSDETVFIDRYHAAFKSGGHLEIPPTSVDSDKGSRSFSAESISVVQSEMTPRISLQPLGGGTVANVRLRNELGVACEMKRLQVDGFGEVSLEEGLVPPDSIGTAAPTLASDLPVPDGPRHARLDVLADSTETSVETIAAVGLNPSWDLDVAVVDVEQIADGEFNVTLDIRNVAAIPVDIAIEAMGDAPDEYLYSAQSEDGLEPDRLMSHQIECTFDDSRVEIPVDIRLEPATGASEHQPVSTTSSTFMIRGRSHQPAGYWSVSETESANTATPNEDTITTAFSRRPD